MGYYFAALSGPYFISAIAFPILFGKSPRKLLYVVCFFISGFAIGFMGPSTLLGLPEHNLNLILIGMCIIGIV